MEKLRLWINNDIVYFILIIVLIIIAVNIFSKFFQNLILLIKNFRLIIYYLKVFFIRLLKILIKTIFFPITFLKWYKEYKFYKQFNINSSRDKHV